MVKILASMEKRLIGREYDEYHNIDKMTFSLLTIMKVT
jgi:hypothetical protein